MVRKLLMTAGVGALVAMAIGGALFASASGEGGGRTIVVIEKTTSQQFVDFHQAGPTAGDEFFFAEIAEDVSCSGMATAEADCSGTRRPSASSCSGRRGSSPRVEIFPARRSAHRADSRDALGGRRGGGYILGDGCLPRVPAHAAPVWRGFVSPTIVAPVPNDRSPLERLQSWGETRVGRLAWYGVEVGVVAGLYYVAARAGLHLAYLHGSVTALWPPVGVGMAALVILGPGVWPGIVIGDLLVADFSTPWGTVLGQTLGNTLEVVVAAVLFRRLAGRRIGLERVWDVLALVLCAAVGTLISAVFGVVSLRLGDVIEAGEFGSVFRTWWLGDFSGALVFAPLVLVWAGRRSWRMPRVQLAEGAVVLAVLIVLIEVPSQADVPYIVFPILIWAALRFGPTGAATAVAITSCLTVWNTAQGSGPFLRQSITHSVLASQSFVAVAALTSLVLAAVTAERSASESAQQALTAEQAALRRIATLVASEAASAARVRAGHGRSCPDGGRTRSQPGTFRRGRHGRLRRRLERERHACVPSRFAPTARGDGGSGRRSGER